MLTEKYQVIRKRNYFQQPNYVHIAKEMFGKSLLYFKIRNGINLEDDENTGIENITQNLIDDTNLM